MAAKEHTAQEWAQLLKEKIGGDYPVEVKEAENDAVRMNIRFPKEVSVIEPIYLPAGDFYALVYANGAVKVKYELCIAYDAQYSYELLTLLNQINVLPGATYSITGNAWTGATLRARDEFQMERFQSAFAGKVVDRMLRTAVDICNVLRDLEIQMPEFFGAEELAQAKAEANLSPEELLRLPEAYEAPPEDDEGEYLSEEDFISAEEFFDEAQEREITPAWHDEWGDEQEFLEKFINEPVENMSGSELVMLNVALQRNIDRNIKRCRELLDYAQDE